jgi:hypothetical protein
MEGTGSTIAEGGIAMSSSASKQLSGRMLENRGLWTWSGSNLIYLQGAGIRNAATGTIDFQGDFGLSNFGGATPSIVNAGVIKKSAGAQRSQLQGSFTQEASGALRVRIAGRTAGTQFDQLDLDAAALDGTLAVELDTGFTPQAGDTFEVLTGLTSRAGAFAMISGSTLPPGLTFDADYTSPSRVVLRVVASTP